MEAFLDLVKDIWDFLKNGLPEGPLRNYQSALPLLSLLPKELAQSAEDATNMVRKAVRDLSPL